MSPLELVVWSMALGAIAAVLLARAIDCLGRPSASQIRAVCFHVGVFVFVLVLSGVLEAALSPHEQVFHITQVLAGPACLALSNLWIQGWLAAPQRDRLMSFALNLSAVLLPAAAFCSLALPFDQQLPLAAVLSLVAGTLTLWLTVRAWLLGDRLAPVMAGGCLLLLPAIGGMYARAMHLAGFGAGPQALAAFCAAFGNGLTGFALWRRDRHERDAREPERRKTRFDPVTRMHTGIALVRKLLHGQHRRRRSRRDGAVLAIMVFDTDRIVSQVGTAGAQEMFIAMAARIQCQVGVVNPVGRYWDRCFVAMVEAIHSPAWLRTLGLRVAASLRKPIQVTGLNGLRVDVRPDIGVGVVHLSARQQHIEDILHEAQTVAQAARAMPSRAAIIEPGTGALVALESADLPARRRRRSRDKADPSRWSDSAFTT